MALAVTVCTLSIVINAVLQRPAQAHADDTLTLLRAALENLLVQKLKAIKAKEDDFDTKEVRDNITCIS